MWTGVLCFLDPYIGWDSSEVIEVDATRAFNAMGGDIEILPYDIRKSESAWLFKSIIRKERRLEKIFSFYDAGSELSTLNRDRSIRASDELLAVISKALEYSRETGGRYDITRGKAFDGRKRGIEAQTSCSFEDIHICGRSICLKHEDAILDLGSIAKGYIVDLLVEHMRGLGLSSGFIDARGDMRVFGDNVEVIGIQHPRDSSKTTRSIVLDDNAVATSGDYMQFFGDYDRSHIIGTKGFSSVTVITDDLMNADAMASCISVLDPHEAETFLSRHKGVKAFAYGRDLREYEFNGIKESYPEVYVNAF